MRKLIIFLQLICLVAILINAGLLIYISVFVYNDPLWYLTVTGSVIQNKVFDYSLLIGLFSFIISLFFYITYKKKYFLKYYLLIIPSVIWTLYLIVFVTVIFKKIQGDRQRTTGGNSTYPQAGVSCFVGQESSKFEVQFFVGSSVVKIPAFG